jgi:starch synthase (maltosyl-transferring)
LKDEEGAMKRQADTATASSSSFPHASHSPPGHHHAGRAKSREKKNKKNNRNHKGNGGPKVPEVPPFPSPLLFPPLSSPPPLPSPSDGWYRESIAIENVEPELDGGRFPVKRVVGDTIEVSADIFKHGRDELRACVKYRKKGASDWHETPMRLINNDRWAGKFAVTETGVYEYTVEAWTDTFDTHLSSLRKWLDAGEDISTDLVDLQLLIREALLRAEEAEEEAAVTAVIGVGANPDSATTGGVGERVAAEREDADDRARLTSLYERISDAASRSVTKTAATLTITPATIDATTGDGGRTSIGSSSSDSGAEERALAIAGEAESLEVMRRWAPRRNLRTHDRVLTIVVDRTIASFAAWYEMFPRSQGETPGKSGTFKDCERRIPYIAELGFDVVYLPPVHPIGLTNRRGPNNSPHAAADDPGSPWAIGSAQGGHKSLHPELGDMDDFIHFVSVARGAGIEVALDIAFQCSPDHPYVESRAGWFFHRSDGTIRYAENPPKKYFDIYPLNFENEHWKGLWQEALSVFLFWVDKGITIFRVDNPHTKPFGFWEWMIGTVKESHPEVIFLAEAFTRPKPMKRLAKLGFDQSYTYFTWKNTKRELLEFLREFVTSDVAEYYRGNFFTNTPDILSEYLQTGGRPAFKIRAVLAATLSSLYGIYSGYELCENRARGQPSEEYLDSEKYQLKTWDWDRPGNIRQYITRLNSIRRSNRALQTTKNLRLLQSSNDNILFYAKWTEDRSNIILVAVNLDPKSTHDSTVLVPIADLGIPASQVYEVLDLITGVTYQWRGEANYVKLDPQVEPAHVLLVRR